MNKRIKQLAKQAGFGVRQNGSEVYTSKLEHLPITENVEKFAELIVKEMCDMMEQAEDDCYHCFEPSERPTEYISWLNEWRKRFEQHFGVEE